MCKRVATQFVTVRNDVVQVFSRKNLANWRVCAHEAEGCVVCAAEAVSLEYRAAGLIGRTRKVIEGEREINGASLRIVTGSRKSAVNARRRQKPCALSRKCLDSYESRLNSPPHSADSHSPAIQKTPVKQFQSQQCVDLEGVVPLPLTCFATIRWTVFLLMNQRPESAGRADGSWTYFDR